MLYFAKLSEMKTLVEEAFLHYCTGTIRGYAEAQRCLMEAFWKAPTKTWKKRVRDEIDVLSNTRNWTKPSWC